MHYELLEELWAAVSALPAVVPLLLLPGAAWLAARAWRQAPQAGVGRWVAGTLLLFGAADWALLWALPRLGLSFGPVGLPLLGISAVRLLLALGLAWLWAWAGGRLPRSPFAGRLAAGLAALWLLNLGVLACEVDGLYVEPFRLQVTHIQVPGPAFFPDRPLRIVHLTDLHVERTTRRERELAGLVPTLQPDLIVLTGDYLSTSTIDDPAAWEDARRLLAELQAPYGVYAVTARTVDGPADELFDGLPVDLLRDEVRHLSIGREELYIVGVSYLEQQRDAEALTALMGDLPPEARTLLLHHPPDLAPAATGAGVDLYLAGHTHGGQIRLPLLGALFTPSAYGKRYEAGRYDLGGTTLYVSRGLGMEGLGAPRARFLCPPEVVVVDWGG
ncbi:MAG: metallophosphoesterase [Anaerolineae bacterium]|jgi:hypothetical protein